MGPASQLNVTKKLKFLIGGFAIVFLYTLFLEIIPTKSEESVMFIALDMEPAVEMQRLRSDLMKNYDRLQRPAKNQSLPTKTEVFFDVQHVVSLNEKYQILTVKGILKMTWTDEHLTWNPSSYSAISVMQFSPGVLWIPDLHSVYNVKALDLYEEKHPTPVKVYNNGSVKWFPPVVFDVPCSAQYRHYPFDSHNCSIVLAAWTHAGSEIVLQKMELPSSQPKQLEGSEWRTVKVTHENYADIIDGERTFYRVQILIFLERMSRIYRYICVIPTLISMVSLLFGFWLLPNETSRYLIGCSNIIVLSMLLQHLAVTVPAGKVVPLLAQYSASCLCISTIFVIITVITNILRESSGTPPPGLVHLAHHSLDRYLCLFTFSQVSKEDKMLTDLATRPELADELKRRKDWFSVATLVDRIAFWCFVFIFVVLLSVLAAI